MFESKRWEWVEKRAERKILDITIRTQYLDFIREFDVLGNHFVWIKQTGREAMADNDQQKEEFYEGLIRELGVDFLDVWTELCGLATQLGMKPKSADGEYNSSDIEDIVFQQFTLRPISTPTETSSSDSDNTSRASDLIHNPYSIETLFTDWFDHVYDLDALFDDSPHLRDLLQTTEAIEQEPQALSTINTSSASHELGLPVTRNAYSLPPFSILAFNQVMGSRLRAHPKTPSASSVE